MYLSFYELDKKPFQISVDPLFLWMSEKHKEALAMFKYGIMDNRGFIMLTGDVGTGKTTLVNALVNSLGQDVIIANITNPGFKRIEFLNQLSDAFGFGKIYTGKGLFLLDLKLFLEKCNRNGKQVLLIIDEAQRLSSALLEEVRLLSNIEYQNVKLLNIFFVGQSELNGILGWYKNRALRQRMTLRYHIEPLSENEIGQFIEYRLKVAGTDKKIFTPKAVREIHAFSNGYPRLINILCDHAMLTGYVANKKTIDAPEIQECAMDLELPVVMESVLPEKGKNTTGINSKTKGTDDRKTISQLYPIIAGVLLLILLVSFFYFPLRAGAYFSDIFHYWIDQAAGPKPAVSNHTTVPSTPRETFKVEKNNSGIQEGKEVIPQSNSTAGFSENVEPRKPEPREDWGMESLGGLTTGQPDDLKTGRAGEAQTEVEEARTFGEEDQDHPSDIEIAGQASQRPDSSTTQQFDVAASPLTMPSFEKHYILTFEFDSNDLTSGSYDRLDKTAAIMADHPEISLTVKGYTDNMGDNTYNVMLSKIRADKVKKYLVTKGVEPDKISTIGKGAEDPIEDNSSYEGRRANRRVEIELNF